MNDRINQDIKMLKLTDLIAKANELVKEMDGVHYIYLSKYSATIEVDSDFGKGSLLCFIADEKDENANCSVEGDLKISFKIPPKPVAEDVANDVAEEDKAA